MRAGFGDGSGPREEVWGVFWCHHFRWTGCVWRETERIKSDLDLSEVGLAPALTKLTVSWSRQMPIYLEGLIQCCSWLIHSYTILAMTYPTGRGIHIFTKEDLGGRNTHVYFTWSFPSRTLDLQIYREAIFIYSSSSPSDPEVKSGTALQSSAMAQVHRSQMEVWLPCLLHMSGSWPLQPSFICALPFHQSPLSSVLCPPPHSLDLNSARDSSGDPSWPSPEN